jgi:DNA-binding XRE family transcriptional regulator
MACYRDSFTFLYPINFFRKVLYVISNYCVVYRLWAALAGHLCERRLVSTCLWTYHIAQSFPKLLVPDPFWRRKISTDPHILAHINIECPDDRYPKLKTCIKICNFFRITKRTHCLYLSIHSILPHRLLVWRMVLFACLRKSFKFRSDCRQMNTHVGCHVQSVTIFRFCCRIPWTSSFAQISCWKGKKFEHRTSRHLRIFLKNTAPELNQRYSLNFCFTLVSDIISDTRNFAQTFHPVSLKHNMDFGPRQRHR